MKLQEDCYCEVIGCGRQAFWLLVSLQDCYSEDWLCDNHWELLYLRDPQRASRYKHLSSLLAEGMGLMDVASTENARRVCGSASNPDRGKENQNHGNHDDDMW